MAAALTLARAFRRGGAGKYRGIVHVALSGSYPGSGGDTIDLRPYVRGLGVPSVRAFSTTGSHNYSYQPGTNAGNGTLKVMVISAAGANQAQTEHTTGAYAATVTADTVRLDVEYEMPSN